MLDSKADSASAPHDGISDRFIVLTDLIRKSGDPRKIGICPGDHSIGQSDR
jgi:hypothetical protein